MNKSRLFAIGIIILGLLIGFLVYSTEKDPNSRFPFRLGLDLDGGTHLTYRADTSDTDPQDVSSSLESLRETIERRVNIFGVSEPIVQIERGGVFSSESDKDRLIIELPGVTDVSEAIKAIGKTPVLEFRVEKEGSILVDENTYANLSKEEQLDVYNSYAATGLGGGQLDRAQLNFDQFSGRPSVVIDFNKDGTQLLADITRENINQSMAIFIDDTMLQNPVIQQEITGGQAQITGDFTPEEARSLVRDLNFGALPLPIELIETQTIGATLGHDTLNQGVKALVYAFGIIFIFLIIWYRLPGLIAMISLAIYVAIMLALFKLIPVTLTASGVAGFILSLGMAVDANVLIFERMKEELKQGRTLIDSVREGFKRAWLPIRDGNLSSIISAVILFWLSNTSLVKGFALVFGIGVLVSMITAVLISRTLLVAISNEKTSGMLIKMFGSGFMGNKVSEK